MASSLLNVLAQKGRVKHTVGNINSIKVDTIAQGAVVAEDMDNFTLGELGFDANGERTVKPLSVVTKDAYLVASVERVVEWGILAESMADFYNAAGERARVVILRKGLRFETSAYEGTPVIGKYANWDCAKKKFVFADTPVDGAAKFLVVAHETAVIDGCDVVRVEVQ